MNSDAGFLEEVKKRKDVRSKKFIFVPFCLICQAFQARYIVNRYPAVIAPIVKDLIDQDVNIIQMPCPESQFGGYKKGLSRDPKGYRQYNIPEFKDLCRKLSEQVADQVEGLVANGYQVVAIMGIEYSPSCAVNYQYGRMRGTVHQIGLFIEAIMDRLKEKNISIQFVGINRRNAEKDRDAMRNLLGSQLPLL